MTRQKPSNGSGSNGEWVDDELYRVVLAGVKSVTGKWGPQLELEWEGKQGAKVRSWVGKKVNPRSDGSPSTLVQLLNAIAERDKADELWFDPDTLEWGYDLDGDDSTPAFAKLREGLVVQIRGENVPSSKDLERTFYKITGYKSPTKAQRK